MGAVVPAGEFRSRSKPFIQYKCKGAEESVLYQMSHAMRKPVLPYANNKGADQPAHPHSLICTFVVHCLDSVISILAKSKISRLLLVSVAEQAGVSLIWSKTPKTGFLMRRLKYEHLSSNGLQVMNLTSMVDTREDEPGAVAWSEVSSLGMQAAPSSIPTSGTFFRGDLVMKTFQRPFSLFRWFKKSSVSYWRKNVH